jgi:hypothetical protein
MDITPDNTTTQPISDDQELAKALAGVLPDDPTVDEPATPEMQFEETIIPTPVAPVMPGPVAAPTGDTAALLPPFPVPTTDQPETPALNTSFQPATTSSLNTTELEGIKTDALNELRPLIDHVDLAPEEKFDTYLMLIRSTDDSTLIAPAHTAAQGIGDEKRKAEALLDIIKEIDYLSKKDQPGTPSV